MKIAFVTPRYGPEVYAGAEGAARALAERLAANLGWSVEAYTSCALDHLTWQDAYAPGESRLNGVGVHRFSVAAPRSQEFFKLDERLRAAPRYASAKDAQRWVELNGPVLPDLLTAVRESGADVVACYPYLYWPSVATIGHVPMPTVLHPAAHDEPALYLSVFADTFTKADALCYHGDAERRLVQRVYRVADRPQIVLGLGVDDPCPGGQPGGEILGTGDRPYLVTIGRVDAHKGAAMLDRYFRLYKERHPGPLALAFVGSVSTDIAPHPDVVVTGPLGEAAKWDLLRDATALVSPSALESFSLVVMEAWTQGIPVVVNGRCEATREHCERSGGGLWFSSYTEFEVVLERLTGDPALRERLGARGRAYADSRYRWPVLIERYRRFVTAVAERGPLPSAAG
jgi:glycosyltransferase involved in cell wall biosynthesis